MGKVLILLGILLVVIGLLLNFKIPIPLGNLPGDLSFKVGNTQIYIPIVSSLILSFLISIVLYIFQK